MKPQKIEHFNWGDFDDPNVQLDLDAQWNLLESKLKAKRNNRRLLWLFSLAGVLVLGAGIFLVEPQNLVSSDKVEKPNQRESEKSTVSDIATEQKTESTDAKTENLQAQMVESNSKNQTQETVKSKEIAIAKEQQMRVYAENNKDNTKSKSIVNENRNQSNPSDSKELMKSEQAEPKELIVQNAEEPNQNKSENANEINIDNRQHQENVTDPIINKEDLSKSGEVNQNELVDESSKNALDTSPKVLVSIDQQSSGNSNAASELPKIDRISKRNYWLQIGLGYGPSFYSVKSKNSERQSSVLLRREVEKPLDGFSGELTIGRTFGRIRVQSGLYTDVLFNKLIHEFEEVRQVVLKDQLIRIEKYEDGTQKLIYGDVLTDEVVKNKYKVFNRFHRISIPLLVGVQQSIGTKYSLTIDGGVHLGISNFQSGYLPIQSTSLEYQNIQSFDFRKGGLLAAQGSAALRYRMNSKWSMGLGVQYIYDLNSRTSSELFFTERHSLVSATLMLQKRIKF